MGWFCSWISVVGLPKTDAMSAIICAAALVLVLAAAAPPAPLYDPSHPDKDPSPRGNGEWAMSQQQRSQMPAAVDTDTVAQAGPRWTPPLLRLSELGIRRSASSLPPDLLPDGTNIAAPFYYSDARGARAPPIGLEQSKFTAALIAGSVLNDGNHMAVQRLWHKLEAAQPVAVAVFGGSVSAAHDLLPDMPPGSNMQAALQRFAWGAQIVDYFNENWPTTSGRRQHELVSLASGGTGTAYAVDRALDRLTTPVDLVVAEFAINDGGTDHFVITKEECAAELLGMSAACRTVSVNTELFIRKLLGRGGSPPPALVYVEFEYFFILDGARNLRHKQERPAATSHLEVCQHYKVPVWDLRGALSAGGSARFGFPPDFKDANGGSKSVLWSRSHPNTDGHRIIAEFVLMQLRRIRAMPAAAAADATADWRLPPPMSVWIAETEKQPRYFVFHAYAMAKQSHTTAHAKHTVHDTVL